MTPDSPDYTTFGKHQPSYQSSIRQIAIVIGLMLLSLLFLWLLPAQSESPHITHYLPLHMLLEVVSIVISMMIFAVGWNAYRHQLPHTVLLLATAFFTVGVLDFSHMLSFPGMADYVTPSTTEKAIDFWLAARFVAASALLYATFLPWKTGQTSTLRYPLMGGSLLVLALIHWLVLYHPDWLPTMFVVGHGLTTLKISLEYVLVAMYLTAAGRLWFKMLKPLPFNAPILFGAACAMGISELFFTLYSSAADIFNFFGHVYKAVAYLFLYRAIVVEAIENPYEKLRLTQNELQATLAAMPDLLFELDQHGRYVDFRANNPDLLAVPAEQIIGSHLNDVLPPEAAATAEAVVAETLTRGTSSGKQIMLEIAGKIYWFELSASRKPTNKWDEPRVVMLSRDITQRKAIEQTLLDKEQFYSSIVNNGLALIWVAGLDKGCFYFNQVWLDFTGRSLAQEQGNGWIAGVHPKDLPHCLEVYETSFNRREAFSMTYRLRRHDGEYRWLIDEGVPRFNEKKEFLGYVGHCFDITDRRRINDTYRNLFQTMSQGVVYHDLSGKITDANLAAQRILGLSLAQMQGRKPIDPAWHTIHPDGMPFPGETHPASITLKSGLPVLDVVMGVKNTKASHTTWIRVSSVPVFKEDSRDLDYVYATFEDITERQRIQNQSDLLSEITQNAPEGISLVRASDGTIHYANRYFETMLGYGPGELFNKPIAMINAPTTKTPEETAAEIISALNTSGVWQGEVLNLKKDGSKIWTSARVSTLHHPDLGTLWVNYQSDITERLQANERIQESEKKYRELIEHSPDVVYVFSTQRGGIYYTPNVEKLLGYTPEHLYANPYLWNQSIHPDDVQKITTAIQKSVKGEPFTIEYRIRDAQGHWKWISDRSTQRLAQSGETLIEGLASDITDRVRDQEALKLAASVFAHASEGIIITNPQGEIVDVNEAFTSITGYSHDEVIGKNPRLLHSGQHTPEFYQKMWDELLSKGSWQGEIINRRKNGELFPEWLNINSILDDDGKVKHWVGIFSDITARKKIEEMVRR